MCFITYCKEQYLEAIFVQQVDVVCVPLCNHSAPSVDYDHTILVQPIHSSTLFGFLNSENTFKHVVKT